MSTTRYSNIRKTTGLLHLGVLLVVGAGLAIICTPLRKANNILSVNIPKVIAHFTQSSNDGIPGWIKTIYPYEYTQSTENYNSISYLSNLSPSISKADVEGQSVSYLAQSWQPNSNTEEMKRNNETGSNLKVRKSISNQTYAIQEKVTATSMQNTHNNTSTKQPESRKGEMITTPTPDNAANYQNINTKQVATYKNKQLANQPPPGEEGDTPPPIGSLALDNGIIYLMIMMSAYLIIKIRPASRSKK